MIRRYAEDLPNGRMRTFNRHELEYPEPKRARRRAAMQRLKARTRWIAKNFWGYRVHQDEEWLARCERLTNHLAHCSGPCCGHRRFWEGPTIQEKRHAGGEDGK